MDEVQVFHLAASTIRISYRFEPALQEHGILQAGDFDFLVAVNAFHREAMAEGVTDVDGEVIGDDGRFGVRHRVHGHARAAQGDGLLDVRAQERAGREGDDIAVGGGAVGLLQGSGAVEGGDGAFVVQRGQQGRLGGSPHCAQHDGEEGEKDSFSHNDSFFVCL